ncbi:pyridoxal phosphate-dependent aminotransferase [Candidatus Atribacteria bacterium 1244-E10-H5-B2]|nr:MAG: pyridoxal phosphate-dependent aminotransferase [Candidatus Atribacteria bacterium 1244-E10-H5-B2]
MTSKVISKSVAGISPSATEETSSLANQLKRQGINIISFAQGEPDFDTPENIKEAAIATIREGFTKYTDVPGIPELRQAVADKFKRENGIDYEPDQILICNGGKQALYQVFRTICEKGDQVLIPTPCYVSYTEQIKLTGAEPVFFKTKEENNFRPTFEEVLANLTPRVKAFIINSPNNPTGSMFEKEQLKKIARLLVERGVYMITDEVYEHIVYDNRNPISVASLGEKEKEMSITINSVSKTYAMTGWRVGYAAGPKEIIKAMINLQGHATGNINSIAQKAAIEALNGNQESVGIMVKEYAKRREYMVNRLNGIEGIKCNYPDGAFYTFPNVTALYSKKYDRNIIRSDVDVAKFFLEKAHVAVVPGVAFNYSGYVRFVFAKSMKEIKEGLERIEKAIKELK